MHWLDWIGAVVCLLLLAGAVRWTRGVLGAPRLPGLGEARRLPARVTIIVAARDEAAHIEEAARSLLGQCAVEAEVIVVDDRSTDGTGAILDRLARERAGLRVVHVDSLPARWLGKCHALHMGSLAASGEWLLFADADVQMAPDLVGRAVALCEARGAEHLALIPRLTDTTLAVRPCLLQAMLGLYERAPGVNREPPAKRTFVGVGAFNLVSRATYDAFGGHEALRLEVIDDLRLGLLVRRAGGRTLLYDATADLAVPYITSIPRLFAVVEKNLFALMWFSLTLSIGASVTLLAVWGLALAGPLIAWRTGTIVLWAGPACLWAMAIPAAIAARRHGWALGWALAAPLTFPVAAAALANSALRATLRGGIEWRGTRYPLADLRRGRVR